MHPEKQAGKSAKITGWTFSIFMILFLLFDSFGKLTQPEAVLSGTADLGYPITVLTGLGITLLTCTILYIIPATAVLGAVLLTGYLGGAIATHVRVGNPAFSHTLFPVYVAILLWAGLFLRRPALMRLFFIK